MCETDRQREVHRGKDDVWKWRVEASDSNPLHIDPSHPSVTVGHHLPSSLRVGKAAQRRGLRVGSAKAVLEPRIRINSPWLSRPGTSLWPSGSGTNPHQSQSAQSCQTRARGTHTTSLMLELAGHKTAGQMQRRFYQRPFFFPLKWCNVYFMRDGWLYSFKRSGVTGSSVVVLSERKRSIRNGLLLGLHRALE